MLSIILLLTFSDLPHPENQNCESMDLRVEVMQTTVEGSTSTVKLRVPEDADIKVVLMQDDPPGPPSEFRVVESELRRVPKGSYDIIVVDKKHKYCSEVRKVIVN